MMQDAPEAPAAQAAPVINIDFGGFARQIIDGIRDLILAWAQMLPGLIMAQISEWIGALWNALWDSGLNIFATPFALTIDFPPARYLREEITAGGVVYGITVLAIVLLALRNIWGTLTGSGGAVHDTVNNVLLGFILAGSATLIIAQGFHLAGLASDAIGRIDYRPSFEPNNLLTIGPNLIIGIFTIAVMLFYGWKLIVKGAYRVILLMFLTPLAPLAGACWMIPQIRWVSVLYFVTMGGWLAGGFLAIGAISLAVQIALVDSSNGILKLVFGVALLQVAADLMSILAKGGGSLGVPSPLGMMLGLAGGAAAAGAVAGAAAGGAASGGGMANAVGALPAAGEASGYGYD